MCLGSESVKHMSSFKASWLNGSSFPGGASFHQSREAGSVAAPSVKVHDPVETGSDPFARQAAFVPSDPLFSQQWHFAGNARVDINITEAWDYYSGAGIKFGVYDDGIDDNHVDLAANYDASLHVRVNNVFDDPTVYNAGDAHGTAVAGLIAARQGNGAGGVGGSFNGRLTGVDIFGTGGTSYLFAAMNEQDRFDVTNHSWGWVGAFADNKLNGGWSSFFNGLQDAAANGRGGLGTIQMVAAGNDRAGDDNTNTSNFTSSRFVNAIAAIANDGQVSSYSNPGASLLVSSPSNGGSLGITTTDYTGSVGYSAGDYTSGFGGTSAATPIASGVVGLILQANPALGYRDVMEILAITARQVGSPKAAGDGVALRPWQFNGADNWNNGGMHFSHDYGFGLIDAFAAVKLAESWNLQQTFANEVMVSASNTTSGTVPDNNPTGLTRTVNLTPASGEPITIEAIEVQINWSSPHTWAGDLVIELISPDGTTSYLLDRAGGSTDLGSWIFTTRAHLGELATGNWTVRVTDAMSGDTGTISSITVRAYGSHDIDDNYYYTDEFGALAAAGGARATLADTDGGSDTINLAALSTAASINLNAGQDNLVAGSRFVIAAGTVIENVIGSWLNDTIIGNDAANRIDGNLGNDVIQARGGNDQIWGGKGSDTVDGGLDTDTYYFDVAWSAVQWVVNGLSVTFTYADALLGPDIISNVEYFIDSLGVQMSFEQLGGSVPADTVAPALVSVSPADNATAVNPSSNFVLNFSEAVVAGSGAIEIRYVSGNALWRSIPVSSSEVSISGSQVTINPGADLPLGTEFYISIASGAFNDAAGNPFAGITGPAAYSFTTSAGNLIEGNNNANTLSGSSGNDIMFGYGGNDNVSGNGGDDVIDGGTGNDILNGGSNTAVGDTVSYASATLAVTVTLASSSSQNTGGAGSDTLSNFENLTGSDFNDRLTGSSGVNVINGGKGNDFITGGGGADRLWGGIGSDTFDFNSVSESGNSASARDVIMDFEQGLDRIDLSTIDATSARSGNNAFVFRGNATSFGTSSDGEIRYVHENGMTIIYGDTDRDSTPEFQIALNGIYTLTSADFIL
jgi:Ca2+-binding RTX toxin-like protein/subtilisin-like proprotein convertase family protein